ncbi:MAG TPA: 3'-5' exonuclease, partial [Xanthomonadales bacterium]|nr:3'-5' exonuclease [Xanthomonadales bacterium]
SLRNRVEQAWLALGGECCYASPTESENSTEYFRLLESLETESNEQLVERLQSRMDKLYATSSSSRLQLMPIHQAKGLEFDVVIIPGMQRLPKRGDESLVELQEFRLADGRNATLMAPIPSRNKPEASLYQYLQAIDRERSGYETQRVLYVACTRARQQLHLLGRFSESKKQGRYAPKGSLMELLTPAFESASVVTKDNVGASLAVGSGLVVGGSLAADMEISVASKARSHTVGASLARDKEIESSAAQLPPTLPLLRLDANALPPLQPATIDGDAWEWRPLPNRDAAALGQAVHDWLELIHDHWSQEWTTDWFQQHSVALKSSLLQAGASPAALPELLQQLQGILSRILQSKAGQGIVSPEGKSGSWAELPLLRRDGNRISKHIIDRLYEDANGLTIVDYKTGADSAQTREQWASQLQRYRELVQGLEVGEVSSTVIFQAGENQVIDLTRESQE